jgi:CDP-diacylglycerol--glycerol-3-phosphate 3-phosphatidyltransferase
LSPVSFAILAAVFGASVLSMLAYAAMGVRRDADQDGKGARFFMGLGDFALHWFMWAIRPLVSLSLTFGLTPDFYNYAGLGLGLAAGISIALGKLEAGGWAVALCGVADILDGRIARATGVASGFGDFIDSTFDRFVEVFLFLGFAYYLRESVAAMLLAEAAMAGSLVVSYVRARGEVLGVLCTGGLMQRGERLVLICVVCLAEPPLVAYRGWAPGILITWMLGFLAVTTAFTALHRTFWIGSRLRAAAEAARRQRSSPST